MKAATERPLPYNADAERAVLGAILLDNNAIAVATEHLKDGDDFFLDSHRRIFRAMLGLADFYQPIELVTVCEHLERHGELEAAGGSAYLSQLMDGMPRGTNIVHYARIIREKSALRKVIHLANAMSEKAFAGEIDSASAAKLADVSSCDGSEFSRRFFHAMEDLKCDPIRMGIDKILQLDGATIIGGLSGHGKTLFMLSIVKALLSGNPLFGHFQVREQAARVIYLIPESTLPPFAHRLRLFGLLPYVENDRLLVRTLSLGPTPSLADPRILAAAKGSDVFLDTAIRFMSQGDENNASDAQRWLAQDIFGLLRAGARLVAAAHHSAKNFGHAEAITLENVLRGSGDFGALAVAAFGLKQIDAIENIIHVECVKFRDLEPTEPFQIVGRPHIDKTGDFVMHKLPGQCGWLADEQTKQNRGGAPPESRHERSRRVDLVRQWTDENPTITAREICKKFEENGIQVNESSAKRYRKAAQNHEND